MCGPGHGLGNVRPRFGRAVQAFANADDGQQLVHRLTEIGGRRSVVSAHVPPAGSSSNSSNVLIRGLHRRCGAISSGSGCGERSTTLASLSDEITNSVQRPDSPGTVRLTLNFMRSRFCGRAVSYKQQLPARVKFGT